MQAAAIGTIQNVGFLLLVSCCSMARGSEHAVTMVVSSKSELNTLSERLPDELINRVQVLAADLLGPLSAIADEDQPFGLWIDWQGSLPNAVVFVKNPSMKRFAEVVQQLGLGTEALGNEVFKISFPSPIYYRQWSEWVFFSINERDVRSINDPLTNFKVVPASGIAVVIEMPLVPMQVRSEIAEHVAHRLLPETSDTSFALSPEGLIHLYVDRLLKNLAAQGERVLFSLDARSVGLAIDVEVVDSKQHSVFTKTRSLPRYSQNSASLFSIHTLLSDEEAAMLSWWAHSVPEQWQAAFAATAIEQRSGFELVTAAVKVICDSFQATIQRGEIEGFCGLVGKDSNTPLIGLQIVNGRKLETAIKEFLSNMPAKELGIRGLEIDFATVADVQLHRITFGELGEAPETVVIGLSESKLYLSMGQEGLRSLVDLLREEPVANGTASPLTMRCNNISIGATLGWLSGAQANQGSLEVNSEYTTSGCKYHLLFMKWTPILGPQLKIENRVFSGMLLRRSQFGLPRKNHDKEATIIHTFF